MKSVRFSLLLLLVLTQGFFVAGCALAPAASVESAHSRVQPLYFIDVMPQRPPVYSLDGFDAGLLFVVHSQEPLPQRHLVQELTQTVTFEYADGRRTSNTFSLVEAFSLRYAGHSALGRRYELERGQFDRHFRTGLSELGPEVLAVQIERRMYLYPANVIGAAFTARGFAQLAHNEGGDVVTTAPDTFNSHYRRNHETRGKPRDSDREGGVGYRISYRLERAGQGRAAFVLTGDGGRGRVFEPQLMIFRSR